MYVTVGSMWSGREVTTNVLFVSGFVNRKPVNEAEIFNGHKSICFNFIALVGHSI